MNTVEEVVVVTPEIEQQIAQAIEPFQQKLLQINEQARRPITNDAEEMAALVHIAQCKRDWREMEDIRDRLVRPYNTIVKEINKAFKQRMDQYDEDWRLEDQARSAFLARKQLAIDEANRRAIADAAEAKRQEEAKAEAARQEVERLRLEAERIEREENDRLLQAEMDKLAAEKMIRDEEAAVQEAKRKGDADAAAAAQKLVDDAKREEEARSAKAEADRLAAVEAQNKIDKQVIKQESKADIAESKATMVTPTIHVNESVGSRTLVDGSKVGTRKVVDWYFENGMPKDGDYYADDPRVLGIPSRYFLLDTSKLARDVKNGVPVSGVKRTESTATTAGRK